MYGETIHRIVTGFAGMPSSIVGKLRRSLKTKPLALNRCSPMDQVPARDCNDRDHCCGSDTDDQRFPPKQVVYSI